jgi:hypothetical protein
MLMTVFDLSSGVVPIIYQVHRARDGSSFATRSGGKAEGPSCIHLDCFFPGAYTSIYDNI